MGRFAHRIPVACPNPSVTGSAQESPVTREGLDTGPVHEPSVLLSFARAQVVPDLRVTMYRKIRYRYWKASGKPL